MTLETSQKVWKPYSIQECDVPAYSLPDPLLKADGTRVATASEWVNHQRAVILQLLKDGEYGESAAAGLDAL